MAKDAYYFTHDSNASQDPKILQMRSVYGAEGYGWYWMLIEQMRDQENYKLPVSGKYTINAIALRMDANAERLHSYIKDCVEEFGLFGTDGVSLWSESLLRRMAISDAKREKARQSALKKWQKQPQNREEIETQSERRANAERTQCDGNAIKLKESKVNNIKEKGEKKRDAFGQFQNVFLSPEEFEKLKDRYGEKPLLGMIENVSEGIKIKGYKYRDFYAVIIHWFRRDGITGKDDLLQPAQENDGW